MNALIIVDVQNDFLPTGALPVPKGEEVIDVINSLQPHFDLVVATQDWHPSGHMSFASSHPGCNPFDRIQLDTIEQTLWPDHCVQGTLGARFVESLNMDRVAAIFRKGMSPGVDSYSGFYDNARQGSTGLTGYLRGKGVAEVLVTGLAGDYCVSFTAMDALEEGFSTTIIRDATRPIDLYGFQTSLNLFEAGGGKVINASDLG